MSNERNDRIQKLSDIKAMWVIPYASRYKKSQNISNILENRQTKNEMWLLRNVDDIIISSNREVSTAGRLTLYRSHGKLAFGKLMDDTGEVQIMFHKDNLKLLKNRPPHKVNQWDQKFNHSKKNLRRHVVKMVIIDDDGKVATSYAGTWGNYSLPWGGVDEGDNFYDAVHREAREETWTPAKVIHELPKVHEYLKKRDRHQLVYGFLCKTDGEKWEPEFIESEILDGFEIQWLDIYDLRDKIKYQSENCDTNPLWDGLDGIFKRDLIILESAIAVLEKQKNIWKHHWFEEITEINDALILDNQEISPYKFVEKYIDVGDFIGIKWELFTTHKWEATIFVSEFQLLSKAIRPLWDKFHGIWENAETAYRQRYLDMIFNHDTIKRFKLRSKFIKTMRDFYHSRGFIEIETPVLWNSASGAAAAPFVTHHNDFDIDMYLHIAPETSLKKATVWWLEKVFEICKNYRNEWSDPSHHQEYTACEHYATYRNYEDNMHFTEDMFDYIFDNIPELSRTINVLDKEWNNKEVNFQTPWQRVDYVSQIQKDSGIDVSQYMPEDEDILRNLIKEKWFVREWIDKQTTATMIDYLYKKVTRPKITGPAFIINYPKTMQPLARTSDLNGKIVEQFQLLINWREILKAYSELVDPLEQQANFDAQIDAITKWDSEATKWDDDFVLAMEYGMPCQSWWWMWLDRIFAMLTEQSNIRDVILFPMTKPENKNE